MSGKKNDPDATPGDVVALRKRLWDALENAHDLLRSRTNDTRLRAIHAVSQASSAYLKVLEVSDLERRLSELEERQELAERQREQDRRAGLLS